MPYDVATAYVQIIPSAKGIGGGIAEALGGDPAVDAAANSAGESIGGKLVGVIKGVIAAAGLGAALGKAITEGAALEQSIGGVKTLFKDSANQVIAAADKAFMTAGVSATDYMEQVTSFSATLLQGLGGDTKAAAGYADKAILQMSDNANKMGTDIAFIQNAYQGFAKDNYTMLDNLKLGYGGTQAEMARLINDSGVLGDSIQVTAETVKDVPFSSIIDAIGVIQDNLDITGTTAEEAATTISGSLASVQAAASNVMANLTLGRDLGPALDGLAQTVSTFLTGNLLPAVWNILSALPGALVTFVQALVPQLIEGLQSFLPQVLSTGTQMIQSLGTGLVQGIPDLLSQALSTGAQMLQSFSAGLVQGIPDLWTQTQLMALQFAENLRANFGNIVDIGLDLLLNFAQGIADGLPVLIEYASQTIVNFIQGINNALPMVGEASLQIMINLVDTISDNLPKILETGFQILVILAEGLIKAIPTLVASIPRVIEAIADPVSAFNWLNLGANIIKGIGYGLYSVAGSLMSAIEKILSGPLDFLKSLSGQALQWGKDMISGFVKGIKDSIGWVINAVKDVASTVTSYLHFSRPDVGPLRNYEEWMPDFLSGIASGIIKNSYMVSDAMNALGTSMMDELNPDITSTLRLRSTITAGTSDTASVRQQPDRALLDAVDAAARAIVQAVQENGGDVIIGDESIYRSYNRARQSQAIMMGGTY